MKQLDNRSREELLSEILFIVRKNPGIRSSEINQLLNRAHSAHYRTALIKQGLIRKEREGMAVRHYPIPRKL